jgi:hypothetical protein
LPEQSLLGRSPPELMTIFCCLIWDSPTWRARSPYLYPPLTRRRSYTSRHWVPFCRLLWLAGLQWRYSISSPHECYLGSGGGCGLSYGRRSVYQFILVSGFPLGDHDHILSLTFLYDNYFILPVGRLLWRQVTEDHNHTLPSHLRLCSLFVASYDSQGLRWKYSNWSVYFLHNFWTDQHKATVLNVAVQLSILITHC